MMDTKPVLPVLPALPVVTFTVTGTTDDHGRTPFTADWQVLGGRRGQCFNADMGAQERLWRDRGYEVQIVPRGSAAPPRRHAATP